MTKTITYSLFFVATLLVVILFVTSKSYPQLALAVVLYPAIAYFALHLFPRRKEEPLHEIQPIEEIETTDTINSVETVNTLPHQEIAAGESKTIVTDIDKRAFLKLIGVAGVSVFLFSLFSKRGQIPFLGKGSDSETLNLKDTEGKVINPAQTQPFDGYQISEVDDGTVSYYGFVHQSGAWFIMKEDTEGNTFRYARGDKSFPKGWADRTRIKYDYFSNV